MIMSASTTEQVVRITEGLVKGRVLQTVRGGSSYFSFQGIPYAQPPVGSLRFKPPQTVQPWTGVREAFNEAPSAPAFVKGTEEYNHVCSEDCLYLNVYTDEIPNSDEQRSKPVLFWIHGGGFVSGSGDSDKYGPDYWVSKETVVVTINYRLGALGFLSLQSELCPGNNGLKDQVEALRWVQRNISAFGGNPDNVTIFGGSAGGAAVQYLMLSPLSKGLFHRAISQSGSALNPWARCRNPVECARVLAELCGFTGDNNAELLQFLSLVPPEELVRNTTKVLDVVEPHVHYKLMPFVPVIEPEEEGAFITQCPEQLIEQGLMHDVPFIIGNNTLDGLTIEKSGGLQPLTTNEEFSRLLPNGKKLENNAQLSNAMIAKIKNFYFPKGYDEKKFADALLALYFIIGNDKVLKGLARNTSRKSNVYAYLFTHDSELSLVKKLKGFSHLNGSFHGDELFFMFYPKLIAPKIPQGSSDDKMIDILTNLWVNFAKYGNPTPADNSWAEFTIKGKQYLDINLNLQLKQNLLEEEMNFWADIFKQLK